jgi:FkbM family methyltransferase
MTPTHNPARDPAPGQADAADTTRASALAQSQTLVRGLYRGFLGREPDAAGLRHWAATHLTNGDGNAIIEAIINGDEYRQNTIGDSAHARLKKALAAHAGPLADARPLTIVDVGAQELEDEGHIYAPLCIAALAHQIIGFEPLEDKLEASLAKQTDGKLTLYPTFIGDGGWHVFNINHPDATSSLLPLNTGLIKDLRDLSHLHTVKTEAVSTSTLDAALRDVAHVDFLKLDIQGFELPALQHAKAVLARTNVVHCEVSFAQIYQGQALFSEVETLLRAQGFYFLDFSATCHYPYHCASGSNARDRLGWGDAVFFKAPELVAAPADLLAQCLIALFIYGKYSLAEFLAERYDQMCCDRTGSDGDALPAQAPLAALFRP